jgi:hypothetical protein
MVEAQRCRSGSASVIIAIRTCYFYGIAACSVEISLFLFIGEMRVV